MPQAIPNQAKRPFPQSVAWRGSSWADVIQYHVQSQAAGGQDYVMSFDDENRLCVSCYQEGGYCTRVPLLITNWAEALMKEAGIEARMAHSDQYRWGRGLEQTKLRTDPLPSREEIIEVVAGRAGIAAQEIDRILPEQIENLRFEGNFPVGMRDLPGGGIAFAFVSKTDREWVLTHGSTHPDDQKKVPIIAGDVTGSRHGRRGGIVFDLANQKLDATLDATLDIYNRIREAAAEKTPEP